MALPDRRGIQPSTGLQDPLDCRQRTGVIRHMGQYMMSDDGIQGGGRKGQGLGIHDRKGQGLTCWPEALAGVGDHADRDI